MEMNRGNMCVAMAAFASMGGMLADGEQAPGIQGDDSMALSKVFHFKDMHVSHSSNGGWERPVMHGTLPTGEFVELHETMLPAGKMPHPPHRHRNTEFVLIRQGKLEFLNNGKAEPAGVGDVIYTASNQLHGLKNVGDTPALYFIVSIGHGQM
jgi:quercetin dioxygenase-like cupin family protein